MAINKNKNNLLSGFSGKIGKDFVIKQYKEKTVVSKFPDMSNVVPTKKQKKYQTKFAKAVAFAQNINNTPALKAEWQLKTPEGKTVFNTALKWYMLHH
ncbi:unnamed protein product [Rotaria sp. Silwood1]|nr:unnamed protein product [Rotaria sp. Silwood1]CAF5113057.1 unnamed protein product [Rotaria sp. Silwood1]